MSCRFIRLAGVFNRPLYVTVLDVEFVVEVDPLGRLRQMRSWFYGVW